MQTSRDAHSFPCELAEIDVKVVRQQMESRVALRAILIQLHPLVGVPSAHQVSCSTGTSALEISNLS
jgi:hypothetical protein